MEKQGERGRRKGEGTEKQRQDEARGEEARVEEKHSQNEGIAEKRLRTERSDTETEAGGEAGPSESQYKKGHMTTDSDKQAIVYFVKDHKELYDKTNEHFKDKARKKCFWEQFDNSSKLSSKVCKTWFDLQTTHYGKMTQSNVNQRQNWIQDKFGFLRSHIRCKGLTKLLSFKTQPRGASASAASAHGISKASSDTDSIEISIQSTETMLQPQQVTSTTAASVHFSVNQQVMDQFTQMRIIIPWAKAGDNNTCILLQLPGFGGIIRERLSDISNEAVKLLSNIRSKVEEYDHQP